MEEGPKTKSRKSIVTEVKLRFADTSENTTKSSSSVLKSAIRKAFLELV